MSADKEIRDERGRTERHRRHPHEQCGRPAAPRTFPVFKSNYSNRYFLGFSGAVKEAGKNWIHHPISQAYRSVVEKKTRSQEFINVHAC